MKIERVKRDAVLSSSVWKRKRKKKREGKKKKGGGIREEMDGWNAREREGRITTSLKFLILVYDATENHICGTLPPSVSPLLLMQNNADTDCVANPGLETSAAPLHPFFPFPRTRRWNVNYFAFAFELVLSRKKSATTDAESAPLLLHARSILDEFN